MQFGFLFTWFYVLSAGTKWKQTFNLKNKFSNNSLIKYCIKKEAINFNCFQNYYFWEFKYEYGSPFAFEGIV